MKHTFRDADFNKLAELWNAFYPGRYAVDADLLRQNTVDSPLFDWGASEILTDDNDQVRGFVSVKRSAASLYRGPDRDSAHLNAIAYTDPRIGLDLLFDAKQTLRNRGLARLVFGMDSGHFFPGCPVDFRNLSDFLMIEGFAEGGEYFDLERDLTGYSNKFPVPKDDELRLIEASDLPALQRFLEREFPDRWRYDVTKKVAAEGPVCVFGLFHGSEMDGFALIQDWTHTKPIGGAVWRKDLGDHWGSLGPIGVSKRLRGRGSGNALLGEALSCLAERGVRRCIIDWTTLDKFYGGHGFEKSRFYRHLSLSLE